VTHGAFSHARVKRSRRGWSGQEAAVGSTHRQRKDRRHMCGMVIRARRDRQLVGFSACMHKTKQRSGPHEGGEKTVIRTHAANAEPCPHIPHITAYVAEPCDPCTLCTHDRTSSTRLPSSHMAHVLGLPRRPAHRG
jgi:hypothetical protein